jgi:hypothetical protein
VKHGCFNGPEKRQAFMNARGSIERYLKKHAEQIPEEPLLPAPDEKRGLIIVIPSLAESQEIESVLCSLPVGSQGVDRVEVIVVVNNSVNAEDEIVQDNLNTIEMLKTRETGEPRILVLDRASAGKALPVEIAGVGAARRVGMDLALRRLAASGCLQHGAIACLDADSPVAPGYIDAVMSVFDREKAPLAGICQYRHRLPASEDRALAIVLYEIWLRYLELGLRICRSPYAYQAVGSCMVASPLGYTLADGMPRRKAGEDFHFLQKVVKAGGRQSIERINGAVVNPSARESSRVPFGTGRAMRQCAVQGVDLYRHVEPPFAFLDLRKFLGHAALGYENPDTWRRKTPDFLDRFLVEKSGWRIIDGLRVNAADSRHFAWAVHTWFDGLQIIRYARRCKEDRGSTDIFDAAQELLERLDLAQATRGLTKPQEEDTNLTASLEWLKRLRNLPL